MVKEWGEDKDGVGMEVEVGDGYNGSMSIIMRREGETYT